MDRHEFAYIDKYYSSSRSRFINKLSIKNFAAAITMIIYCHNCEKLNKIPIS